MELILVRLKNKLSNQRLSESVSSAPLLVSPQVQQDGDQQRKPQGLVA